MEGGRPEKAEGLRLGSKKKKGSKGRARIHAHAI